jgi:hypothetical protein
MDRRQFLARVGIASVAATAPAVAASQPLSLHAQIEHHIAELRRLLLEDAPDNAVVILRPDSWDGQSQSGQLLDPASLRWI